MHGTRVPERIVVVVSPGDRTAERCERVPGVEVIRCRQRLSAGAARNLGVRVAGDCGLLLFVDADCRLDGDCLAALLDAVTVRGCTAAAAAVRCEGRAASARLRHLLEFKDAEGSGPAQPSWQVPSATLLCRKQGFAEAGGFPDLWPGEDLVFCRRLHSAGRIVRRVDDARTYHVHPEGWCLLLRHQYRLGRTSALARRLVDLHGSWLVRYRWLAPLLVLARAARGGVWVARFHPRDLVWLFGVLPAYLVALTVWTAGFAHGAREPFAAARFLPRTPCP